MSQITESATCIRVDPTNPGQFFACCGLLELADRLWDGAEGWFSNQSLEFIIRPTGTRLDSGVSTLIAQIARCRLTNTMTDAQLQRRAQLSSMRKQVREATPALEAEKKSLDALWREAPILLHEPFNLRLDWFLDDQAGGDTFKTWAGQQSVLDIASGMKASASTDELGDRIPEDWLSRRSKTDCLPFNFDSDLGGVGSDRDVGFSFDPLKAISVQTRPLVELLAFVGLQRFRPIRIGLANRYRFALWLDPLVPEVAAPTACGLIESPGVRAFEFQLLYRTKYLKSFLPATPLRGANDE